VVILLRRLTVNSKMSVFALLLLPLLRLLLLPLLPELRRIAPLKLAARCLPFAALLAARACWLIPMLLRLAAAALARLAAAWCSGLLTARIVCGCCSSERRDALPVMLDLLPTPPTAPPLLLTEALAFAAARSFARQPPLLLLTLGFCLAAGCQP
jgi:hypothetical protein